jgi:hypothetical protein
LEIGAIELKFGFPPELKMNVGMRQLGKIKAGAFNIGALAQAIK